MHAAKPLPICHCDVRLANVLWGPQPFLADLELAHFSPWQVILKIY
jgi:Ser/Thr protein kinase RdoA (MazF antagonist)